MIVLWLMLVGVAAALVVTARPRPARPQPALGPAPRLPERSRAFLNWLTNLIGALLAGLLAISLWRRRR